MASLTFWGAAGTVTGSRFLLEHQGRRVLVDCGLFQGEKAWRKRNWESWPFDVKALDAVVLTHAHIDHTGGLPGLVRAGFRGPVYCTSGTRDLCGLLLPDSARLQEEEARYANKEGYSRHHPALPLYDERDAREALKLLETFGYHRPKAIVPGLTLTFHRAGHILGSAVCDFALEGSGQRVVFSGDLGRFNAPILQDPERVTAATTLVAESTYGDRTHGPTSPADALAQVVNETVQRGGVLVVPAFAIGRTQDLLYHLDALERAGRIPELPVFVDSPMACDATPLYLAHPEEHDEEMQRLVESGQTPLATRRTRFCRAAHESRALNAFRGPGIIISASGMATGGRVLHHLKHRLPQPRNTVLFVGYQAWGTRGRKLLEGATTIRIHGQEVPVAARLAQVSGFSAHADVEELLSWMDGISTPPRQVLLVHGEPQALSALAGRVEARGWPAHVPAYGERVELS